MERKSEIESPRKTDKISGKFSTIFSTITVEPTFFLTICTSMMYQITTQNLYLEKACRVDIGYNESICDAMTNRNISGYSPMQEVAVQKLVSQMFAVRTTIQGFFPVCLVFFVGSWTDRHNRRKPAVLFPIMGEIICCVLLIINVIFFYELPIIFTTLGDCLFLALCGGWPCLFLGIYSYLAANSSQENRTVRIGVASACQMIGIILGVGMSGFIFRETGFLKFYILSIGTLSTALILGFFLIKEKRTDRNIVKEKNFFKDLFEVKNIVSAFRVFFKKESTNRRIKLIVLLIISTAVIGPIHGENNVTYLYTRHRFGWNFIQYGTFYSANAFLQICGAIFSLIFFAKVLKFEDSTLGILALTGSTMSSLIFGLAPTTTVYYFGAVPELFYITSHVALRAMISKLVLPNELGQVNSIFGVVEALMPLIFGPFYTLMYKSTIVSFPSTFFVFSASSKFTGLCCFIWLYVTTVSQKKTSKNDGRNLRMEQKDSV